MKHYFPMICSLALSCSAFCAYAAAKTSQDTTDDARIIHLRQDDAQTRFASRLYQLKYAQAEEMLPFVNSAIQRYNRYSTIRRVPGDKNTGDALLVSTGKDFLPYVDSIVAALDRPGKKSTKESAIQGTGLARIAYTPKYRAAQQFEEIIDTTISSSVGKAYVNRETNTIFWRDQSAAAKNTLAWVEQLDRPIPQIQIRLNYYELRDSDLKDWGFDFLAWKNGPGVNLLNVGYNVGHFSIDQVIQEVALAASSSWDYGGFFTAPQFDMSFIRCLQQSGNASVAADTHLTVLNTPVSSIEEYHKILLLQDKYPDKAPFIYTTYMQPEYQNIAKNTLGRTFIGKSFYEDEDGEKHADPPNLEAKIVNPFICRPNRDTNTPGGVIFDYGLYFKNVVERGNTGAELSNSVIFTGSATLGFNNEKLLAVYDKENDVEQTIGIPILCRIPYVKYLFSTVTTIKERTYIVITAEASLVDPHKKRMIPNVTSETKNIQRRIENPFRKEEK